MLSTRHQRTKPTASFKQRIGKVCLVAGAMTLAGCQMTAQDKVSVDYYAISGNTTAALDREIKAKGPRIGDGRHAVAVARIRMIPTIRFKRLESGCKPTSVKVAVNARVTLPRWTGRDGANSDVGRAWDNIDRYTRLHEAVHVAIAFRYASDTEKAIENLPPTATCDVMKAQVSKIFKRQLRAHDKAQRAFDAREQRRFAAIARRQAAARAAARGSVNATTGGQTVPRLESQNTSAGEKIPTAAAAD
ncbi:MAG: DUF922 domain-containing protein [Pseudomonadota bacterium]